MGTFRIAAAAALLAFAVVAHAFNMSFLNDSPITRLTAEELKQYTAFTLKALDEAPDGATLEWKAPKSEFISRITLERTFTEANLTCRDARIEADARDRHSRGTYTFCKVKGVWTSKIADAKSAR
jgi:surface antigen